MSKDISMASGPAQPAEETLVPTLEHNEEVTLPDDVQLEQKAHQEAEQPKQQEEEAEKTEQAEEAGLEPTTIVNVVAFPGNGIIPVVERAVPAVTVLTPVHEMEGPVNVRPLRRIKGPSIWQWLIIIIALGVLIVVAISSVAGYWIRTVRLDANPAPTALPTTTLNVHRSAAYAGLDVNVVSAQYAEYFSNDNIRPGQGIIRLNMKIFNRGSDHIKIVYYNSVRLIAQGVDPIVPTNLALSAGPDPGKSENGWIDFSVAKQIPLDKLMLQLGDSRIHESLVKIPFKGDFDASRYADRSVKQDLAVNYVFVRKFIPYALNYHLNNVEVRYAFQGVQCKEGQQFYIFDFTVSNPGGGDIIPGSAYNYLRLVINGYNQFPIASTLTDTIHGNAQGVKGQVVFSGPTDMHTLDLIFLKQYGSEQYSYWVNA